MENVRNIVVLGAGESGNGAALLAKAKGVAVFVSDFGLIAPNYQEELEREGIPYEMGGHSLDRIFEGDLIIKSPGIPETAPVVKALREAGKSIISEIEWGFRYAGGAKIIAITGTNGKSTTTMLTGHILRENGVNVKVGGNIGISFARLLAKEPPADWYVLELSSFQLDDISSFRPDVAVILNITPDHLNRYQYDFHKYVDAKFNITAYQDAQNVLVINKDDQAIRDYLSKHEIKAELIKITMNSELEQPGTNSVFLKNEEMNFNYDGDHHEVSIHDLTIKGQHNIYNSMAAGISARVAGIRSSRLKECFSTFNGLEHRLEYVSTIRGVEFINDSKGTNLNSVWFALESMTKPVVLILGGQDKGNNYNDIKELVEEKVKAIVCLGLDNHHIVETLGGSVKNLVETKSAKEAVEKAFGLAENGDVVLLSPGCASFDLFKNFEDRGQQFKEAVHQL